MPNLDLHAKKQEAQSEVTLEQLLKLKRYEKPDPSFWERFDRDLQQRTLQTLVKRPSVWSRMSDGFARARPALISATACFLFGAFVFWEFYSPTAPQPELVSSQVPAPPEQAAPAGPTEAPQSQPASVVQGVSFASTGQARFVVDSLSREQENGQYRKVMAGEGLSFAVEGVRYVADPLSGGAAARVFASTPSLQHF